MMLDEALAIINRASSSPTPQPNKPVSKAATAPAIEPIADFVPAGQLLSLADLDKSVDTAWVQSATVYRPNWPAPDGVVRKDPTLVYDVLTGELCCLLVIKVTNGPHSAWPSVMLRYPCDVSAAAMDRATLALEKLACP